MAIRLLIVDDETVIRKVLERHFAAKGYEVVTAVNGKDAITRLEQQKFDIVVTDLLMPEMDGFELLKHLREEFPLVRVIIMTGAVNLENMLSCLKDGAFTFVTKPLDDLAPLEDAVHIAAWVVQGWLEQLSNLQRLKRTGGSN